MALIRTETEVDKLIADMVKRSKGKYITQGVSFNKESALHLMLLKMVLMSASSFGAFVRELIAKEFQNEINTKEIVDYEIKFREVDVKEVDYLENEALYEELDELEELDKKEEEGVIFGEKGNPVTDTKRKSTEIGNFLL